MHAVLEDGTKIYYNVNGEEKQINLEEPCLILLHGGPGIVDHSIYLSFWKQLEDVTQVIFIDMRGHGKSEGYDKPENWNLEQWGKDVYDFCKACKIDKPIVAGVSFGGWVALSYATQYPEHPKALILCHTEAKVDFEERKNAYRRKAEKRGLDGNEIVSILQKLKEHPENEDTSKLYVEKCIPLYSTKPYLKEDFDRCIKNEAVWTHFEPTQYTFDFFPVLQRIISPVLILAGEEDPEHPPECANKMRDEMINSQFAQCIVVEGAGAPIYREKEEETLEILKSQIRNDFQPLFSTQLSF